MRQRTLDTFVHAMPKFRCVFCNQTCMSGLDLASHVQTHAFITCQQCPAIFKSHTERNVHEELHVVVKKRSAAEALSNKPHQSNSDRTFQCTTCNQTRMTQDQLDTTARNTKLVKKWTCELCDNMEFTRKDNFRRHVANKHGIRCRHCNISCTTIESRKDHEDLHRQDDYGFAFLCTATTRCVVRCATQEQLAFHIETNHSSSVTSSRETTAEQNNKSKLAAYLQSRQIVFTRDWSNQVDFVLHLKSTDCAVFIDVDEEPNKQLLVELDRSSTIERDVQQDAKCKDKPILYVRFNTGCYLVDNIRKTMSLCESHNRLLDTIDECTQQQRNKLNNGLNIVYMFYDVTKGQLDMFQNTTKDVAFAEFANKIVKIVA